jgi:hypothetical protein
MMTLLLLFFPLLAAVLVLAGGPKAAAKMALALTTIQLGISVAALCKFLKEGAEPVLCFLSLVAIP